MGITVSTVTYMLSKTLEDYGNDDFITNWVDNYNVYYAPILNPDGYEYTRNGNRMWRKTMCQTQARAAIVLELTQTAIGIGTGTRPVLLLIRVPSLMLEPVLGISQK